MYTRIVDNLTISGHIESYRLNCCKGECLISYKKRSGTTVVEIQLKGSFEVREIAAIFQNSANYCYDITGVIGYVVDCRKLSVVYDVVEKKRMFEAILEILQDHVVRIALVYNEEQFMQISYGILHNINSSNQFHISVVKDTDSAYQWLDKEIQTFAQLEREEQERREAVKSSVQQPDQHLDVPIEVNPHEAFILENASPFVHPDAAPQWTPSAEAEQNRQVNHKLRENSGTELHRTYENTPVAPEVKSETVQGEETSYDHYFISEKSVKSGS